MKICSSLLIILIILIGCDNITVEGPSVKAKYNFSTKSEFGKHFILLQDDHGGIKSWVPSEDMDCRGGKVFTLADGYKATFCPANGDESLFK
jgi:hypothetical protein